MKVLIAHSAMHLLLFRAVCRVRLTNTAGLLHDAPDVAADVAILCSYSSPVEVEPAGVSSLSPTELDVTEAGLQYSCGRLRDADASSRVLATDERPS